MALGIVQTTNGKVEGVDFDAKYAGITEFRGIPYAAPPVGKLRFMPPAKVQNWDGVRKCDKYGDAAIQTWVTGTHGEEMYYKGNPPMSEDCLYLNITTGAIKPHEKRPVYLWLHGGGLTNCHSYELGSNPQELARKGVVVVSPGHRLNVFGFLSLPQLSSESGFSGNYGFLDLVAALDWTYENIASFGGDPDSITAGGESGGCQKAAVLAASRASRGRIKRIISESGLKWQLRFMSQKDEEEIGLRYLEYAGLDPNMSLDKLRALDTYTIYKNVPRIVTPNDMVCDGDIIPFSTLSEMFDKDLGPTDFLNGVNIGEGEIFAESEAGSALFPVRNYIKQINTASDFYAHFHNLLGILYDKYHFRDLVKVTDADALRMAKILAAWGLTGREGMNFSRNLMENRIFGAYMAKRFPQSKVFNYLWSYALPVRAEDRGTEQDPEKTLVPHGVQTWYTFASLREGVPPTRPWREKDFALADIVNSYWVNFIKTGDPNGEGLPLWPVTGNDYSYVEFAEKIEGHTGVNTELDKLIRDFVKAEYKLEI